MELLNEKAYFSALSGLEVEDGLKTINEALNLAGTDNPAMLDTRACIQYRLGKYDLALNDMNVAIRPGRIAAAKSSVRLGRRAGLCALKTNRPSTTKRSP